MRTAFLVMLLACAAPALRAQQLPVQVNLDQSTFAYDDEQSLVEIYLAFDAVGLDYETVEGGFLARLPLDVALFRAGQGSVEGAADAPLWQDSTRLLFSVPDTAALVPGQQFVHQIRTLAAPGEYTVQVTLPAAGGRPELALRRDVLVPDYADETATRFSDVTMASQISQSTDAESPFFKNGLVVRPNATQLFGAGLPRLFYYAELYRPGLLVEGETYTLLTYISEANRLQPIEGMERRAERPLRPVDVLVGSFNVGKLPSGPYVLRLVVLDRANESVAEQQRRFFVYNPNVAAPDPGLVIETTFETSPYVAMTQEEVEKMMGHIDPILNDGERRRLRNLTGLEDRQRFLMDFWAVRDPNPATEINEFKEEYYQRVQYAADRYGAGGREGWRTERGRVLLEFGLPSALDPHLFSREEKPYEIWTYNNIPGQGQAMFVFYDPDGYGDFRLLHSTVPGQRQNPDWQRELVR